MKKVLCILAMSIPLTLAASSVQPVIPSTTHHETCTNKGQHPVCDPGDPYDPCPCE